MKANSEIVKTAQQAGKTLSLPAGRRIRTMFASEMQKHVVPVHFEPLKLWESARSGAKKGQPKR